MTKVIRINNCDESCPYYKETPVYDNSPDIRCIKYTDSNFWNGRKIPQWEEIERPDGYTQLGEYLGGKIPPWCPLDDEQDQKD
jgi:hypothetical protein